MDIKILFNKNNKLNGKLIKKYFNEILKYSKFLNIELPLNATIIEHIFCIFYNIKERPKCKCGEYLKFINFINGYGKCTVKCIYSNLESTEKRKKTCIKKYNVSHIMHLQEIKNKIKNTCIEKYNETNYSKTQEYKDKCKKTSNLKYGVDYYTQTIEWKNRVKNTCIKKYNTESVLSLPRVRQKLKQYFNKKYNVDNYMQTSEFKNKLDNIFYSKYGKRRFSQTLEYKEKLKNTCIKKYNKEHFTQTNKWKEKYKKSILQKFNTDNPFKNKLIKNKIHIKKRTIQYKKLKNNLNLKRSSNPNFFRRFYKFRYFHI